MELGMIGLGRMGGNMVERLVRGGHRVVVSIAAPRRFSRSSTRAPSARIRSRISSRSCSAARHLAHGAVRRSGRSDHRQLLPTAVHRRHHHRRRQLQLTTTHPARREAQARTACTSSTPAPAAASGGCENGYCLMVGGEQDIVDALRADLQDAGAGGRLSARRTHGAGHFVKMVHNGIEYGMLQAYAEGFEICKPVAVRARSRADLRRSGSTAASCARGCSSWRRRAFANDPSSPTIKGYVEDSGEGRWTVQEAIERDVPAPVITLSLFARFASRQEDSFAAKVIAALRNEFGGHAVKKGVVGSMSERSARLMPTATGSGQREAAARLLDGRSSAPPAI